MGRNYDYVILGAGAAGLSLLMRIISSPSLESKKILLVDKSKKNVNDRTWCFWEASPGFFEEIVFKKWNRLSFQSLVFSSDLEIDPYQYKMIRGKDFYDYCFTRISRSPSVEIVYGEVRLTQVSGKSFRLRVDDTEIVGSASAIFNSMYDPTAHNHAELQLLQHFKGWIIETSIPQFNPQVATLMDFRVEQHHGTTFAYVLPLTDSRALIEYTLFTSNILSADEYRQELTKYIHQFLGIDDFSIVEEEFGIIPMTNARFEFFSRGMYHIGMAGGQTKPSTGYTFQFIQRQSDLIVKALEQDGFPLKISRAPKRFAFYDDVLLKVLLGTDISGREIFTRLFQRNPASKVFAFLDNESTLPEELKLISSLQTVPFIKAALKIF